MKKTLITITILLIIITGYLLYTKKSTNIVYIPNQDQNQNDLNIKNDYPKNNPEIIIEKPDPVVTTPDPIVETQTVLLGQEFNLYLNKTVKIKDTDLELTFTNYNKSCCPEGVMCIWAGETTTTINVKSGNNTKEISNSMECSSQKTAIENKLFGYTITVINSGSSNYATIKVSK